MRKCFSPVTFPRMFLIILFLSAVLLEVHPFYVLPSLDLHLFPTLPPDAFVSPLHCLFMLPSFTSFSLTLHLVGGRGLETLCFTTSACHWQSSMLIFCPLMVLFFNFLMAIPIHFSPFSFSVPFLHSLNQSFSVPAASGGTFNPEARHCPCCHIWFPLLLE